MYLAIMCKPDGTETMCAIAATSLMAAEMDSFVLAVKLNYQLINVKEL